MNLFDMFESEGKYILYFNDKPVSVYKSAEDAEYQARLVQKKVPDLQFSIKQEVCKLTPVELQENLRDWFKDKWVRFGPDGKIRGDCARGDDSEGKPKCLPQSKAHALGKKGRAKAAARKRRQDPNPERSGAAINVKTKEDKQATLPSDAVRKIQKLLNDKFDANLDVDGILGPLTIKSIRKFMPGSMKKLAPNPKRTTAVQGKELKKTDENISEEQLDEKCWDTHKQVGMKKKGNKMVPDCVPKESIEEAKAEMCPECGGPMFSELLINEKKDACYYKVKSRYKVWPSAYASGALVKCRKKGAKNWGSKSESVGEGYDKWGWHTSVKNGEFMPTKYGNKAYVYLHDLDNESPRGGPQLVTVNKPTVAKRIAQQFGGKVVKTDLNTYRIVKPAEQEVEEGVGKDLAKLGGMSALAVGAGLAGNYADQQHPKVDIGGQQAYLIKNPGLGRVPDTAMILKGKDGKTYKVWSPSRNNKTLYATPVDDIKEGVAEGSGEKEHPIRDDSNEGRPLYTGKDKQGTVTITYEPAFDREYSYCVRFDGKLVLQMRTLEMAVYGLTHSHFDTFRPNLQPNPKTALKQDVAEGDIIPFKRPQAQPLTWKQVPKDVLLLANEWFWASEDDSGLAATLDPKGFGSGTRNAMQYAAAKLQQKGWSIDHNDEYDKPGEYNLRLTNRRGQTVLLPIEDAQDFKGWAQGTGDMFNEQGVAEGLTESGNYLYCQNPECGVYLGSLGGNWCPHCGWEANDDEQGAAEGSDELYQQAIRKYVQRVANNYLGGGNAHLYGAGNFDSEMFGVDPKQAEQDFDTLFPQYLKKLQGGGQGVAEGSDDHIWGPQGRFAGDTPVNIGGATIKKIQVGDVVTYFGEKAKVIELGATQARISANGKTLNVRKSDLKQLGQDVAEGSLNEWVDPGAPCQVCGKPHDQHRVKFNRKNPKLNFIKPDDEWNDLEMSNAEDHEYVPSKGYEPLSQREAELVGFDNLNVNMPDDIYNRINSVRQRISRVGQKAGQLTRVKEQGVAEGSDTTTFNEFHEWKEAVYNLGADITQMGKAGQYTAIGSNGVIGEFNGRTNTGWIKGQQGVAEGYGLGGGGYSLGYPGGRPFGQAPRPDMRTALKPKGSPEDRLGSAEAQIAKDLAKSKKKKQQRVAEGEEQSYKITYDIYGSNKEKPLYTNTRTVRASSEQEAIDILRKLVGGTNYRVEKQGVAEVSNAALKSYQQKVSADSMKHSADPTKRSPEKASRSVAGFAKAQKRLEKGVAEAGPFSYGAKKPRKGSVADLAAKKRKEQERDKQPIEPKDQMVGVAKVTKGIAEGPFDDGVVGGKTLSTPSPKAQKVAKAMRQKQADTNYLQQVKITGAERINEEGAVEAYGYVYDKRDQRIVWRKIFPSIEAAQAWADKKNATIIGTKPAADVKEEIDTGITKVDNDIKSIDQGIGEDQDKIDTVEMDVPFLIRALEYAREDAKDDLDLHNVVERMLQAAQNGEALDMADYNRVFGQSTEPVSEDDLGVEPKRPPRKGSRHERGHEPVPRYHYHKDVEEGWGAERQQREHEATQKEWADVLERHKDNPQVMKILKDLQAKFWRGRDAEAKALAVVNGATRQYYETIGTPDNKLREEFQMRKDSNGWYLKEDASRKLKLEALRAFGPPRNMI